MCFAVHVETHLPITAHRRDHRVRNRHPRREIEIRCIRTSTTREHRHKPTKIVRLRRHRSHIQRNSRHTRRWNATSTSHPQLTNRTTAIQLTDHVTRARIQNPGRHERLKRLIISCIKVKRCSYHRLGFELHFTIQRVDSHGAVRGPADKRRAHSWTRSKFERVSTEAGDFTRDICGGADRRRGFDDNRTTARSTHLNRQRLRLPKLCFNSYIGVHRDNAGWICSRASLAPSHKGITRFWSRYQLNRIPPFNIRRTTCGAFINSRQSRDTSTTADKRVQHRNRRWSNKGARQCRFISDRSVLGE